MPTLWFWIVAVMLAAYVVLDGFDIGAGILHLFIAKSDDERRMVFRAIGPVWDGNEVWLLATGGTLYFAFPALYASSFSGFYLPLMIVLWLLILRGLSIEFRAHLNAGLWRSFFDAMFAFASILLAIVFGAALGNVVRGVPLGQDGYFFVAFWASRSVVPDSGILDWYTILMGLVSLFVLANHGGNYVALKTEGAVQARSRTFASRAFWGVLALSVAAAISTFSIRPEIIAKFVDEPAGFLLVAFALGGLFGMWFFRKRNADKAAFISSSLFILGMLASTAFGAYPVLLRSSIDPRYSLTVQSTAAADYGLSVGVVWFLFGIILVVGYFVYIFRLFRGKVTLSGDGY